MVKLHCSETCASCFVLLPIVHSVSSKPSQFTLLDEDASKRLIISDLTLIQPFTDLGFDTLAKPVTLDGRWSLERITADLHIIYMACPL